MWHPDVPPEYRNQIVTGDARELAQRLPAESVDLIFTDPLYDSLPDYQWLAEASRRLLKPNGALFCSYGVGYLPQVMACLQGLRYRWDFVVFMPNAPSNRGASRTFCKQWRVAWFDIGGFEFINHVPDVYESNGGGAVEWAGTFKANGHEWVKNPEPYLAWIRAATAERATVFDPFTGGGTVPAVCKMLGRNYIAFEIDPDTAERARERVAHTNPPLFVLPAEQLPLELNENA